MAHVGFHAHQGGTQVAGFGSGFGTDAGQIPLAGFDDELLELALRRLEALDEPGHGLIGVGSHGSGVELSEGTHRQRRLLASEQGADSSGVRYVPVTSITCSASLALAARSKASASTTPTLS